MFVFLFFPLALIFWQWAESLLLYCSSEPHFCPRFVLSGFLGTSSWSWTEFLWKELNPNYLSATWKTWSVHTPLFSPPPSHDSPPTVRTEELSYLSYRYKIHLLWQNTECIILCQHANIRLHWNQLECCSGLLYASVLFIWHMKLLTCSVDGKIPDIHHNLVVLEKEECSH